MTIHEPLAHARKNWIDYGWGDAEPGMASVSAVVQAGSILRQRVEDVLQPYALTFPRYEVLTLLRFSSSRALPVTKVATRLQIQPASLTHTLRKLEDDQLVARTPNPKDKRVALISITDQGLALVGAATPALNDFFRSVGIDRAGADELVRLLGGVLR